MNWSSAALQPLPPAARPCTTAAAGPSIPPSPPNARPPEKAAAVRFAVPDGGSTAFDDAVFGRVEFANAEIEDFVLLRSDGIPTYHLSVVADDIDMRLTHIIRGADHISNTPKQVLQYQALGAPLPIFAHVPLILGPDKTRLSKRHGATSVISYKEMGIVPEAFRNFLALLGWTPGSAHKDREIFSSDDLVQLFSLDGISKSNAVFDNDKLAWFNTEYIRAYDCGKAAPAYRRRVGKARIHSHPLTGRNPRRHRSAQAARPQPQRFR